MKLMTRITPTLTTALLFVVSGCASNAGSPTALPLTSSVQDDIPASQAPNALDQLAPADETRLTLRFKNTTPDSILEMAVFGGFDCISSVEPKRIKLTDGQTGTVVITADTKQLCQGRDRSVPLDMYFAGDRKKTFNGSLRVHAGPPKYVWAATLSPFARKLGLCTNPDGFENGRQVHDGELIEFSLCK